MVHLRGCCSKRRLGSSGCFSTFATHWGSHRDAPPHAGNSLLNHDKKHGCDKRAVRRPKQTGVGASSHPLPQRRGNGQLMISESLGDPSCRGATTSGVSPVTSRSIVKVGSLRGDLQGQSKAVYCSCFHSPQPLSASSYWWLCFHLSIRGCIEWC